MFRAILFISLSTLLGSAHGNPMQPDSSTGAATTGTSSQPAAPFRYPVLQTIVIVGDIKKAIFKNAREVTEGGRINGFLIAAINAESVTLVRGNKKKILYLRAPGEFKLSPATEE